MGCRELQHHLVMEYHDSSSERSSVFGDHPQSSSSSTPLSMPPHSRSTSSSSTHAGFRTRSRTSSTHNGAQNVHSTHSGTQGNGVTMMTNGSIRSQNGGNVPSNSSNGISTSRLNKHNSMHSSANGNGNGNARSPPVSQSSQSSTSHLRPPLPFDDMKVPPEIVCRCEYAWLFLDLYMRSWLGCNLCSQTYSSSMLPPLRMLVFQMCHSLKCLSL